VIKQALSFMPTLVIKEVLVSPVELKTALSWRETISYSKVCKSNLRADACGRLTTGVTPLVSQETLWEHGKDLPLPP
jgi:hypothetical protein